MRNTLCEFPGLSRHSLNIRTGTILSSLFAKKQQISLLLFFVFFFILCIFFLLWKLCQNHGQEYEQTAK